MNVTRFVSIFEKLYPKCLAENWDKVGLLICGNENSNIQNVLISNDLTMSVVQRAKKKSANLILCYHPLIFKPFSTLSQFNSWQEQVAIECIKNDISVYAFHTIADNIMGGMNDYICSIFNYSSIIPIKNMRLSDFFPFCIDLQENPSVTDITSFCADTDAFIDFDSNMELTHLWFPTNKGPVSKMSFCSPPPLRICGSGRIVILLTPMSLSSIIDALKTLCGIDNVSFASNKGLDTEVSSIAVCAGAGGSLLSNLPWEVYISGEMSHHQILEAVQNGKHVILTNHTSIENPFLKQLPENLKAKFSTLGYENINFESFLEKDPLKIV